MDTLTFIRTLIGYMHTVIAAGMHPLTGEMDMPEDRRRAIVADTFAMIRSAYAAIVAASQEDAETKTKREAAHKVATAKFAGLLESAFSQKSVPAWAIAYREMDTTSRPAGGDKETAVEVQKMHDTQLRMITETFLVTNPWLAGIETEINRVSNRGRQPGSRNKPKAETSEATDSKSTEDAPADTTSEVGAEVQ